MTPDHNKTSATEPDVRPARESPGPAGGLRRLLRPFRRAAAKFAFVNEERQARKGIVAIHGSAIAAIEHRLDELGSLADDLQNEIRASTNGIEALRSGFDALRGEIDSGFGARADLTITELWRRLEYADARQTTEIQRLSEQVQRILEENAEIRRSLDGSAIARKPQ
jgi:chaperonin cofactor prefoldin